MPDAISSTQLILLTSILGVLLLLTLYLARISNILARIAKQLGDANKRTEGSHSREIETRHEGHGAYETFLSEDPNRLKLSKKECFELYRIWRKEKGLNWVPPNSDSQATD